MNELPHTVVLLHACPDGSSHFDWLLQLESNPERSLFSLRMQQRPDLLAEDACVCGALMPPHRTIYLSYEGPLTGNRGSVRRVAEGSILEVSDTPPSMRTLRIQWHPNEPAATYALHLPGDSAAEVEISRLRAPAPR